MLGVETRRGELSCMWPTVTTGEAAPICHLERFVARRRSLRDWIATLAPTNRLQPIDRPCVYRLRPMALTTIAHRVRSFLPFSPVIAGFRFVEPLLNFTRNS
jgi:hypothetical protein